LIGAVASERRAEPCEPRSGHEFKRGTRTDFSRDEVHWAAQYTPNMGIEPAINDDALCGKRDVASDILASTQNALVALVALAARF